MKLPTLRPLPLALTAAFAFAAMTAAAQTADLRADTPLQIGIAARPLGDALADWSRQTGIALAVPPGLVDGKTAPAVSGRLTPRQALDRLLADSGLVAAPEGAAIAISRAPAMPAATLPNVTVRGAQGSASEGTGSFTVESSASATGLDLSIRETPQSVSVVTRQRIDDQSMTTVADALQNTTGVSVKPVDRGRNNLSARGFEITNFQFDGIPVATGNVGIETAATAIYDRIEVVRGSTGLLNGPGDPSASVNLVRKHADSRVFTGSASVEAGSWNQFTGTVDLSTPLNADGSVRARFVASANQQDSFVDLENTKYSVFYGVVDADLAPGTRLSIGASDQRTKRNGVLWAGLPYWYSDGTPTDWPQSKTSATTWNQWDTTEQSVFATLTQQLANGWSVRADANWNKQNEDSDLLWMWGDPDRITGEGMEAWPYHYGSKPTQTSFNLTASGPFQLGGREHELLVGAMISRLKSGWLNRDPVGPVPPVGDFNNWDGSYPQPQMTEPYVASEGTTRQAALYGVTRLRATDALTFILGGRLSNWERKEEAAVWTPAAYEIKHNGVFTPYAGLVYDINPDFSAYASYTDIFKPQDLRDRDGTYLDPVQGRSYEIGLKGDFLEGKLFASAAIFRIEQQNYGVPDVGYFVPGTTDPAYKTARGVVSEGYELEATGAITPAWNVNVGWTQFKAQDADGVDVAVDHPRKMLKLFTTYTLPGAWNGLSVGGGVNWESQKPAVAVNPATGVEEQVGQGAYTLVELMARYAFNPQVAVQLNIYNVLDTKYRYSSYWWGAPYTYGEPRKVLVTLDYRF